jgi:hypothetical protein
LLDPDLSAPDSSGPPEGQSDQPRPHSVSAIKRLTAAHAEVMFTEDWIYLFKVPPFVPKGMALCHNWPPRRHQRRQVGLDGWRIWLAVREPGMKRFRCGWAPVHYT